MRPTFVRCVEAELISSHLGDLPRPRPHLVGPLSPPQFIAFQAAVGSYRTRETPVTKLAVVDPTTMQFDYNATLPADHFGNWVGFTLDIHSTNKEALAAGSQFTLSLYSMAMRYPVRNAADCYVGDYVFKLSKRATSARVIIINAKKQGNDVRLLHIQSIDRTGTPPFNGVVLKGLDTTLTTAYCRSMRPDDPITARYLGE